MPQKINQAAISAAIKKHNAAKNDCPHCTKGKIGKAKCVSCKGSGTKN
jgi:hypothetical protein